MRTECIIEMVGMSKFRFTPDMTWRVNDFFNLYFLELFLNKDVSKKEYLIAWMEAVPHIDNMPHDLKKSFFDIYWTGTDSELDTIVKKVYTEFHEQSAKATANKKISSQG